MKDISFQFLPPEYLVPKKFHCVHSQSGKNETVNFHRNSFKFNCENNPKFPVCEENWLPPPKNEYIIMSDKSEDVIFKKCSPKTNSGEYRESVSNEVGLPVQVIYKSSQAERITQFQLITSNKIDNYKTKKSDLKWCPTEYYERPKQQFSRNGLVKVTIKDASVKSLLDDAECSKKEKPLSVNLDYKVTYISEENINIESLVEINGANKPFLRFLTCRDHEEIWEALLKRLKSQLYENIKEIQIEVEMAG